MPLSNLAEPVDTWETRRQKSDEQRAGQADDVEEVAFDPVDETRAETLDRIAAGPSGPLARGHVVRELARRELAERHERRLRMELLPRDGPQAEPRDDGMRATGQRLEHRLGL